MSVPLIQKYTSIAGSKDSSDHIPSTVDYYMNIRRKCVFCLDNTYVVKECNPMLPWISDKVTTGFT